MSSWCTQLKQSIIDDSKWKATILFKSSYATALNNLQFGKKTDLGKQSNSSDDVGSYTDIKVSPSQDYNMETTVNLVDFLDSKNPAVLSMLKTIASQNDYPNTAIFHFEDYDGFEKKALLCNDLKVAAFKFGTILNIEKNIQCIQ